MNKAKHKRFNTKTTSEAKPAVTSIKVFKDSLLATNTFNPNILAFALVALSVILYFNSLWGLFVYDDSVFLTKNAFVQKGISGIKDILSNDSMLGLEGAGTDFQGGRYRPIPLIVFAIEHSLWNSSPYMYHLVNVLLYATTVYLVFKLLKDYIFINFRNVIDIAFVATLIFAIHPIHTEVVANIKSRDEIFSLMFAVASLIFLFKSFKNPIKKTQLTIYSSILFLFALLSKEMSFAFLIIIPLTIYYFTNNNLSKSLKLSLPFYITFFIYFMIRVNIISFVNKESMDILNNPFRHLIIPLNGEPYSIAATLAERFGTVMYCLLKYLLLLVVLYPLSYDYTFNQIPLTTLSNPFALLSFIIHLGLLIYAVLTFKKKSIVSYCIFFYLVSIFIVSNLVMNIGAQMGERFLFQPSLAYCIILSMLLLLLINKLTVSKKIKQTILITSLSLLTVFFSIIVIDRNVDWHSEYNLFLTDVKKVPNSTMANNHAAIALLNYVYQHDNDSIKDISDTTKKRILISALKYNEKALTIYPRYADALISSYLINAKLYSLDSAETALIKLRNAYEYAKIDLSTTRVFELANHLASLFSYKAKTKQQNGDTTKVLNYYEKATIYQENAPIYWNDLGRYCIGLGKYRRALNAYERTLKLNPQDKEALQSIAIIKQTKIANNNLQLINQIQLPK